MAARGEVLHMLRADIVLVAASGDYGKPRPAVIVQTDAFPLDHGSVVICQMTSEIVDAPDFRITIDPKPGNGLLAPSQIIVDKPVTVRRSRIGKLIGRLDSTEIARLNVSIAFVMDLTG